MYYRTYPELCALNYELCLFIIWMTTKGVASQPLLYTGDDDFFILHQTAFCVAALHSLLMWIHILSNIAMLRTSSQTDADKHQLLSNSDRAGWWSLHGCHSNQLHLCSLTNFCSDILPKKLFVMISLWFLTLSNGYRFPTLWFDKQDIGSWHTPLSLQDL